MEGTNDDLDRDEKMVLENMVLEKKIKSRADELKKEAGPVQDNALRMMVLAWGVIIILKTVGNFFLTNTMALAMTLVSFPVILLQTVVNVLTKTMALVSLPVRGGIIFFQTVVNILTNIMALVIALVSFLGWYVIDLLSDSRKCLDKGNGPSSLVLCTTPGLTSPGVVD